MKSMTQQRAILRLLKTTNLSPSAIARTRGKSPNTVLSLKERAENAGLTLDRMNELRDSELYQLLFPKSIDTGFVHPVWENEVAYMEKGYNKSESHLRYVDEVGLEKAFSYSAYCKKLKAFLGSQRKEFRHIHRPGYAMQIDFAGYMPKGLEAGQIKRFQLLVTVLPASSLIFAVAIRSQKTNDHIEGNILALEYFGGVPEVIISDNLKAAVISWTGNTPNLNKSFLNFADYYGLRPKPARVRKPKDKAAVENAVKYIQRLLKLALQNQPLMELKDINVILREIIEVINNRKMRRRGKTRVERFNELEKGFLLPLPGTRLTFFDPPRTTTVPAEYHITYDKSFYSVPHRLTGMKVSVRANSKTIEVRHDGILVARHKRSYSEYNYITEEAHRHPNHSLYNKFEFDDWKTSLPQEVCELVDISIGECSHQRTRERAISTIRKLLRIYGKDRVTKACYRALKNEVPTFKHVTNLLANNREGELPANDRDGASSLNATKNIRGGSYFFPSDTAEGASS